MNVIAAVMTAPGDHTKMKHFTIDAENHITVHASRNAARDTGAGVFSTEEQFADLIGPNPKRLVEIRNSLPGVRPVTKFTNRKVATERIWKAIQGLGERATAAPAAEPRVIAINAYSAPGEIPAAEPATAETTEPPPIPQDPAPQASSLPAAVPVEAQPGAAPKASATVSAQAPDVAPPPAKATRKTIQALKPAQAQSSAKAASREGVREGSKTAQVVALLQRDHGATFPEIMQKMGWLKHTVRGFMAGAMKKAGYTVESFKPEGGQRTYRINADAK
jgi:hypothetical protein